MKTKIIYEDDAILICKKPAGFPVQTKDSFRPDMVSELKNELSSRLGRKDPYLGVIHRLDQPVEGLIVFARTGHAAAELSRQLTDGRMKKKYLAVLTNAPSKEQGICVDYLKKEGRSNLSRVTDREDKDAKRAELSYEILATCEKKEQNGSLESESREDGTALAEIEIRTGRHHQIRVQMAHIGCALMGDMKYGQNEIAKKEIRSRDPRGTEVKKYMKSDGASGLALCAYYLELEHPDTKKRQCYVTVPENPFFQRFEQDVLKRVKTVKTGGT
jgi:23S rRNA pseudouridine1911/1915/1917 synthase